jgi:hypothetical protein
MEDSVISALQSMAVREDAIRLGGSDPSFFTEYDEFLVAKIIPGVRALASGSEGDSNVALQRLVKCLELIRPSATTEESGATRRSVRYTILEALSYIPLSFEPGPASLSRHIMICNVLWSAIESDHEENALVATKTFSTLYRNGHVVMDAELSTRLHRFVQWLRGIFTNPSKTELLKEAPGLIHLLVQVFSGAAESYLTPLLGDLVNLLQLADQPGSERLHEVQVKTLTFIAYIGRSSRSEALRALDGQIAKACVKLLRSVPTNANINTRRELLLNLRSCFHCPDLCVAFVPLIDDLFDETVIVGLGRSAYDLLRPIVVSALADFTNVIKDKIPMERLRKILGFFCSCMADSDLPVSSQFTSARIILNLIDQVFNKSSSRARKIGPSGAAGGPSTAQDGSDILREILRAIAEKFTSLVLFIPKVISLLKEGLDIELPALAPLVPIDSTEVMGRLVGRSSIPAGIPFADLLVEGVREVRSLIRTLLLSAKMIVHCLTHRVTARLLTKTDMGVLESLLEDGLKVSHLFSCAAGYVQSAGFDMSTGHSSANGGGRFGTPLELATACSIQEERDLIEQLAGVLTVIPQVSLTDLLSKRISWLIDSIQTNSQLMVLCNTLIQSPTSMTVLCEVIYGLLAVKGEDILIGPSETNRNKHQSRYTVMDDGIGGLDISGVLGAPNACAYFISDNEAIDGALLVTHIMPSLDPKLREYKDIVNAYQLRESPVKIDGRDVVLTIGKSLARQVVSGGNPIAMEPIVRPFVSEISVACIRVAKAYSASSAYCAGTLRYLYRLMGCGTKTSSTIRDLSDLVSVVVDQCVSIARHSKSNPSLYALWLEVALTVPVRLKSLVPCFELMMAVLIETLSVDATVAGETIAVGLSVLESWVDGLTPDFLFPLIPGHSDRSLIELLIRITAPPKGATVHNSVSGNNSVRAVRILGKLGVKSKFVTGSYNVVGESASDDVKLTTRYLIEVAGQVVEIDLDTTLHACISLFEKQRNTDSSLPVSLQDAPADANEVAVLPVQELLDSLNIIVTALSSHRTQEQPNSTIVAVLYRALVMAASCGVELVAERARAIIADLVSEQVIDIAFAAIDEMRSENAEPRCEILEAYVNAVPVASTRHQSCPEELILVVRRLSDRLLSLDWNNVVGAARGLVALTSSSKAALVFSETGDLVISRCIEASNRNKIRAVEDSLLSVVHAVLGLIKGSGEAANQDDQIRWLESRFKTGPIRRIVERCVESIHESDMSESVLAILGDNLKVSVSALVCWVDPDMDILRSNIEEGRRPGSTFRVASFVVGLRPAPELRNPHASENMHKALMHAISKSLDWMEQEDELKALYDPTAQGGSQQQAYLLQRGVMKRYLETTSSLPSLSLRAIRLLKLALLHPQLNVGSRDVELGDRVATNLWKSLFSFDFETVCGAMHAVNTCRLNFSIDSRIWAQILSPLCRESAMRVPTSIVEVQGLGRLLQLTQAGIPEEAKAELADRLFEKLQSYLSALRERTFTPLVPGPVASCSWRCDPLVGFAAVTLECFGSLQTERFPLVERLLQLASQLDSALPSTFGSGQISSPFLNPLIPALCIDPERTADQVLTKMELHKVFGLVAELVSLKACLGLRKSLQDKCHQMSLMDTGVLMMRTAAASLISVLSRHDASYLWIQYCSVLMKASMGLPRSLSLIESLVRNWESSLASLTSSGGPNRPAGSIMSLSPGGIMGPLDGSSSVNSYEGRIISWSVMQFLRAPIVATPGIVTDIDSHLNIRVRLLIRLATSLSLKYWIEVSPIQDWFLTEAVVITTQNEKKEVLAKICEAFSDGGVGLGCKFSLLRYLLIPQLMGIDSDEEMVVSKICSSLFTTTAESDEAVRVELLRVLVVVFNRGFSTVQQYRDQLLAFIQSCLCIDGVAVKQQAVLTLTEGISAGIFSATMVESVIVEITLAMFESSQGDHWKKCLVSGSRVIAKSLSTILRANAQLADQIKFKLKNACGNDVHVWKWFLCISEGLDHTFLPYIIHLMSRKQVLGTTDARVTALEVALVASKWDQPASSVLGNFFLRHATSGPEPHGPGAAAVSPTLWSEFMEKCLEGIKHCSKSKLTELGLVESSIRIPHQQGDIVRHCKQLVALGRVLNAYVLANGMISDPGHVAHFIGLAMVSTDKSVAAVLGQLATTLVSRIEFSGSIDHLFSSDQTGPLLVLKQLALGIHAGLSLACNNTSAGAKLRVHPTNPHSPSFLVTPYTAATCLIGVLRGLDVAGIKKWLSWTQPLLVKACGQSSRSLILGLLPQQLHSYALSGTLTKPPVVEVSEPNGPAASFAYQGVLQGPEFAVSSLLEIVRLAHVATDLVGAPSKEFRESVAWLIECLGPFISLASPNHQNFSNILVALNITAPNNGGPNNSKVQGAGGLASVISVVHLSALLRHCVGIVGRWCLGPLYSIKDNDDSEWIIDQTVLESSPLTGLSSKKLVLSLSTSLIGSEALLACCDLIPVIRLLVPKQQRMAVDSTSLEYLNIAVRSMDGLGVLCSLTNEPVKKMLGFVPSCAVSCFPGSVVDGPFCVKSGPGGLFALTSELILQVMSHMGSKPSPVLLPSVLLGCCSSDRLIRNSFVSHLRQLVPLKSERIEWLMKSCPWGTLVGRMFLPVMVDVLLSDADDRVTRQDEGMVPEFAFIESVLSLGRSLSDGNIALSIFEDVFSQLCDRADPVVSFLSKNWLNKQSWFKPNVPQAIIRSCRFSLPPHLLVYCAKQYGLCFEALEILDAMDPSDPETCEAVQTILKLVGDKDGWLADILESAKDRSDHQVAEIVALMTQGRFGEARSILGSEWTSSPQKRSDLWIEACKSLSDWTSLADVEDPSTRLESFSRSHDWGQASEIISQHDWSGNPRAKLLAGYLGLAFSDSSADTTKQRAFLADMEASINRALHQIVGHINKHQMVDSDTLLICQQLVELGEAAALITDVRAAVMGVRPTYPNPKQILNAWRDRVPDKLQGSDVWYDLLNLRTVVFKQIQQLCAVDVVAQTHISPFLHDLPWTLVKLATHVSDPAKSQEILNRFQQSLTRSTDAFNQELFEALKHQVKLYAPKTGDENDVRVGLNVLNCCAISHSNSQQAAEMSWLQGRLMKRIEGMEDQAKNSLLFAVNTYPMIAKAWIDLGDLLYDTDVRDEECMMAYMMGLALRPSRASRIVPRLLLLAREGCVSLAEKCKESQPSSVWIFWVPILVYCLSDDRIRETAKALLNKISLTFPQSVFWYLDQHSSGASEISEEMLKTEAIKPLIEELNVLRNHLERVGEREDPVRFLEACLDDLRYKRATPAEIKQRLGRNIEISESSLMKLIKSERGKSVVIADDEVSWSLPKAIIEMPGTYTRHLSVPSGTSMESMSFVKIAHVESSNGSHVVLVGSNGLRYSYLVERSSGSFDGLGMQTSALINELLGKVSQSKLRDLKINCVQTVPVSDRIVLREAPSRVSSWAQILVNSTGDVEAVDSSVAIYKSRVESASGRNAERMAFDQMELDDNMLISFIDSSGPSELYAGSKRFTHSLGTLGMVDHVLGFAATDRPLTETLLRRDGSLFVTDASACRMSNHTHIDVPMRLTRNSLALLGERNTVGVLPAVMRAVVDALDKKRASLFDFIALVGDDDDVAKCQQRIEEITETDGYLFTSIEKLINDSRDSKNLVAVQPKQWLPWM